LKLITWIAVGWFSLQITAHAESIDCAKSSLNTELLICRDIELLHLDNDLDKSYQLALATSTDKQYLTIQQRQWLRDVRNSCMNSACLKNVYKSRIGELQASSAQVLKDEKLVPFKVQMPSVCSFADANIPENTVVFGAGGERRKKTDFQIDQSGYYATQIDVAVNYPDKPVALMLAAYEPTIWNIGWTEGTKIVAVFVSGYHRQHVAGIKADTPQLIDGHEDRGPCSRSTSIYMQLNLTESLVASFGYGQITDIEKAVKEQKLSQILFGHPIKSIFSVSEGRVVIGNPLTPSQSLITSSEIPPKSFYDKTAPLAGEAGLRNALKNGILRRATLKDAEKWNKALKKKYAMQHLPTPNLPPDLVNAYVILKEFTYPEGLYGGNSATFYIPEGVPNPIGNYGHSKIYDFNSITLECVAGSACGQAIMGGAIGAGSTQRMMVIDGRNGSK
jgi:uncharacterized protein